MKMSAKRRALMVVAPLLGGGVADQGRAVDQTELDAILMGPAPERERCMPQLGHRVCGVLGVARRDADRGGLVVDRGNEQRDEVVAPGHVSVQRRRRHLQLSGDLADHDRSGAAGHQQFPADGDDSLDGDGFPGLRLRGHVNDVNVSVS